MNSRLNLLGAMVLIGVLGCSSAPEKQYEVRTYQRLSASWMMQADRKRQLEQYNEALALYRRALKYAQKRNDLFSIGIAKLKSAAVYVQLKQFSQAEVLIKQAVKMNEYEPVELDNPIKFIRAKLLYAQGNVEQSIELLRQLEKAYISDQERNIYYRLVRWSYQPNSVSSEALEADFLALASLIETQKLNNMEIYSFALFEHAKWLVAKKDEQAKTAINKAISHFSMLELTNRIKACYLLAVDYYQTTGQIKKAEHFSQRAEVLH